MGVGTIRDKTVKRRDRNVPHTLGDVGKTYSKTSSGHTSGDRRSGQTHKKPKDLSGCEDRGCEKGGGVYVLLM